MQFKVIGMIEGKHRILMEDGTQKMLDEAGLKRLQRDNVEIKSQDRFPHEAQASGQGGSKVYDLAITQLTNRIAALEAEVFGKKSKTA